MSKQYVHKYNRGRCRFCDMTARYEEDETTGELVKKGDLKNCTACKAVQYCCKDHQLADWENHKKFCKRFRKLIKEYKVACDTRPRGSPKPSKPTPYPLHDFIRHGNWQGVFQYLKENPSHNVNEGGDVPDFMSPLMLACGRGEIECVQILLNHGANFTNEDGPTNQTPLIYASWWGHDDVVQLLLNKGADVNQTTTHGVFALGMAATHLQPHVVKLLLRYGANVHQYSTITGWTPLMSVVCIGGTDGTDDWTDEERQLENIPKIIRIVKTLLRAGADINARGPSAWGMKDTDGDTALNLCCSNDKIEVMKLLIDNGAMLDVQRASDGRGALLAAAEHNQIEAVELLIRRGANTSVRDNKGRDYTDLLRLPWEGKRVSKSEVKRLKTLASSSS